MSDKKRSQVRMSRSMVRVALEQSCTQGRYNHQLRENFTPKAPKEPQRQLTNVRDAEVLADALDFWEAQMEGRHEA